MSDDQVEKILGAFAPSERVARCHLFEVMAHQTDLLWTEDFRLPRWIGCGHNAPRFPLVSHYIITANVAPNGQQPPIIDPTNVMQNNILSTTNVPTNR